MQVLVVEREPSIARLLASLLDDAGYRATVCADPPDALATAKALQPHVLVGDLLMDGSDGSAFYAALRTSGIECPVVICSAWDNAETAAASLGLPVVLQPFDIAEFMAVIAGFAAPASGDTTGTGQ